MTESAAPALPANDMPLVSAEWLASHRSQPDLLILDIRSAVDGGRRQAYEEAHIPGALYSSYTDDGWRAVRGMATGLLPDGATLKTIFARFGLRPSHHVIVVSAGTGAGDFSAAARVYWTLRIAGHRRVSILEGGMAGWRSDPDRPVEAGAGVQPPAANPYPVSLAPQLRADVPAIERALAERDAVLLDSRALGFFEGRDKSPQALRPGRLPGAVQIDLTLAFDPASKRLRPLAELQALFAPVRGRPVVHYCNTGHQAATNWFIMSELLGEGGNSLYDGSMSEWTEDPDRPTAIGPEN